MAFVRCEHYSSSELLSREGVGHLFSTRLGGVSENEYTRSMNVAEGRGDPAETVAKNIDILARTLSFGRCGGDRVAYAPQIHSATVRRIDRPGLYEPCDGFITDVPKLLLMVRVADCMPILMLGEKDNGAFVVAALHAGWRGTAAAITHSAIARFAEFGIAPEKLKCALGPSIRSCCYSVGDDMKREVAALRGERFADEFIIEREALDGKFALYADLAGMNRSLLMEAGVLSENIDISPDCTACESDRFHSHRASHGKRGTMGALIGIL